MADYGYALPDLRSQILSFKVAQLQNCAGRLGISKSGKKAEVQNRLLCYFGLNPVTGPGDISAAAQGKLESSARVIKDVYCHSKGFTRNPSSSPGLGGPSCTPSGGGIAMNGVGIATTSAAVNVASNGTGSNHPSSTKIKLNTKITSGIVRCLCKNSIARSNMVQCSEPSCGVWQHADCVGEAANDTRNTLFYCEQCRAHLADPFWKPLEQLLPVAKLKPTIGVPPIRDSYSELHPQQAAELTVYLSEQQLSKGKNLPNSERVTASCLLLDDPVPCRVHWPRNVTMRVNRYPYRVYGRSTTSKMGINQRDEAANIASLCLAGRNTLDIQAVENGTWLILLHRVEGRTMNQVKEMMLPVESVEEAVARVKKLMHDDEFSIAFQVVSLIDPWSGQRMTTPARFTDASGLQAFDLDSFLSLAQRNRKWQDPMTLKNSTVRRLQVDSYIKKVLACLSAAGGACLEVREIVISDEGKWRPEGSDEAALRWFSIEEDEEVVKKDLKEVFNVGGKKQAANEIGGGKSSAHTPPPAKGGDSEGVFLSDTESDEEEELREAASAVQNSALQAALAGKKRKAESELEPEVICLLSDSDDDNGAGAPNGGGITNRSTTNPLPRRNYIPVHLNNNSHNATASVGGIGRGGAGRNLNAPLNGGQHFQGYAPQTRYPPYHMQGTVPGQHPALMRTQSNAPVLCIPSSGAAAGGGGRGPHFPHAAPPQPVPHNSTRPQGASPPRPPPAHPGSLPTSPGGAGRELSQSAQQALAETLAAIHGNPSLMDEVNEDDW